MNESIRSSSLVLTFALALVTFSSSVALAQSPAQEEGAPPAASSAEAASHRAYERGGPDGPSERELGQVIGLVATGGFYICVLAAVGLTLLASYRKERQRHETLRLIIEKGGTIPPELLVKPESRNGDLRRGLVLIGAGVGTGIMLKTLANEPGVWSIGIIPFLIGLAYLSFWLIERRGSLVAQSTNGR